MELEELVDFIETKSPPGSIVKVHYRREGILFTRPGFIGRQGVSSEILRDSEFRRRNRKGIPKEYRDEAPVGEPYLDLCKYCTVRDGKPRGNFPIEARMIEGIQRLDFLSQELREEFKPSRIAKIRRKNLTNIGPEIRVGYMKDIENGVANWRQHQFIELYSHSRYGLMEGYIRMYRGLVEGIVQLSVISSAGFN